MTLNKTPFAALLGVIALAAAGAALAQSSRNIPPSWANESMDAPVSTVSRAQVQAELAAARQDGRVNPFDTLAELQPARTDATAPTLLAQVREHARRTATADTGLSRAQVREELEAARRSGELDPFDSLVELHRSPRPTPRAQLAAQ